MKFLSMASGIEAASQAWGPLGWTAVAFAEIESFPCDLLARHYPDVPNWGDMTKYEEWPDANVDVLCGGTPCQSFSIAGLRAGLSDPRGDLMLTFGAIAAKYRPRWLVWENVFGVLSSNEGRDFAAFLGLLTGQAVEPPADGWENSGVVAGIDSAYGVAWRVLDAQYAGVPQRRRRVFVIGHLGDWRRAAAVLFERHSLSGNPAPSRKARQDVAGTITGGARGRGGYSHDDIPAVASLRASAGRRGGVQDETGPGLIPQAYRLHSANSHAMLGDGEANAADQVEVARALDTNGGFATNQGGNIVLQEAFGGNNTSGPIDVAPALRTKGGTGHNDFESEMFIASEAFAFKASHYTRGKDGAPSAVAPPLSADADKGDQDTLIAFDSQQEPVSSDAVFGALCSSGSSQAQAVAFMENVRGELRVSDVTDSLKGQGGKPGQGYQATVHGMQVRRLTPLECERLQGMADHYTAIDRNGKPAADGPRYKSLGNSWAIPDVRWLGERIMAVDAIP